MPILNAAFPLTAPGSALLFGPGTLCGSVAAGLIQQYCSNTKRKCNRHKLCMCHTFNSKLNDDIILPLVTVHQNSSALSLLQF